MLYEEFTKLNVPTNKCYAVHTHPIDKTIERDLIIDTEVQFSLSNIPYIHINNFHSTVKLEDIKDIIVTKMLWGK